MLGRVWNFIKRHKKKFIFTSVVIGGGVFIWKYAQSKLEELQEKEAAECLSYARKQHHFDSNQRTCNMTVLSMLPKLRETLMQALDSEALTAQLKSKPSNKVQIWEELKILSFTRTMMSVYMSAMMIVFLRVQLNIIGGYMYLDNIHDRNGTNKQLAVATQSVQHKYLEKVHFLTGPGLMSLTAVVKKAVQSCIGSIPFKQTLTLVNIEEIFRQVRQAVEQGSQNGFQGCSVLCQFILPQDCDIGEACSLNGEEIILAKLMKETQDIVDGKDFQLVLDKCLETGFSRLVDRIAEFFQQDPKSGESVVNPNLVGMPLAKIVPIMNGMIHTVCADVPNTFVQELLMLEPVKDFAANVYEAFTQSTDASTDASAQNVDVQ
ncbi:peroxisomal biogenesis factor 3 [Lingula anatina]|uniref:Peroxisomal biogenesis factor 3 n=1 Tax=Lingula anatina TaxID=7574 RepID=A0A1S3HL25_LINAN|nr:peroxisomal biogenesis factor 3 [Lingula anatina]|eukprot:XP_013386810.1 peroxisomal biogenesis factor 3 [Lingula anatina]